MWSAIKAFFARLFGQSAQQAEPVIPEEQVPQSPSLVEPETPKVPEHTVILQLKRAQSLADATIGTLWWQDEQIATTLEGPLSGERYIRALPAGTYPLTLSQAGGLHATYAFRFGDRHQGVLKITAPNSDNACFIQIGHHPGLAYGSVLVGESIDSSSTPAKLVGSETSYLSIYPRILQALQAGDSLALQIES